MRWSSLALVPLAGALALAASGCGSGSSDVPRAKADTVPSCPAAWKPGWQRLANRIHAPVYCPSWLPEPLTGQITGRVSYGGAGGYTVSVSRDRSYLASLIWFEQGSGEVHVNLRGYPGSTRIPRCPGSTSDLDQKKASTIPCFSDARGRARAPGVVATVYTANQGADQWHVLYAWHHAGSLYTVSEHVAEPLTYAKVIANLNRMLRSLVLVRPSATA